MSAWTTVKRLLISCVASVAVEHRHGARRGNCPERGLEPTARFAQRRRRRDHAPGWSHDHGAGARRRRVGRCHDAGGVSARAERSSVPKPNAGW